MRGFPLLNGLAVLVGMMLLWFPLSRLTGSGKAASSAPAEASRPRDARPVFLRLKFAHPPLRARVSHLGIVVWEETDPAAMEAGFEATLPFPPDGIDLALAAEWPEDTPETALQLEVEPEGLETRNAVAWGQGSLDEVLAFVWPENAGTP